MSEVRAADRSIPPGVESDMGEGDEWPDIRTQILESEILIFATPTWLGRPSSFAQRVLERMDAMIAETDDEKRPIAYNRVAGVVVTGNEDGAHHVISEVSGALGVLELEGLLIGITGKMALWETLADWRMSSTSRSTSRR